jgi:hypothetical protein
MFLHFALIRKKEMTTTARNKGYINTWDIDLGVGVMGAAWCLFDGLAGLRTAGAYTLVESRLGWY